ncbi:MAG TPA: MFS transporter [Candidatus Eisenbergiella merdavium]|uniref:MFS transporter n=1 Tax=Candidatus Eisenbergiella merdavium TaxID=2838551 RepID=A0A9D2NDX7_9FIRM|nr:MFS transporter [Candidatus Eisenbergiella merdavium]
MKRESFVNKNYILMILINTLYTLAMGFATTHLTVHGTTELGMSMTLFGSISSAYSILCLVMRPVSGSLVSKLNPKGVLAVSLGIATLSYLAFAVSGNVAMFILAQIIRGIGFGMVGTCLPALVSKSVPRARYSQALGIYMTIPMITGIVSPSIIVACKDSFGYAFVCVIAAVCAVLAIVFTCMLKFDKTQEEAAPDEKKKKEKNAFRLGDVFAVECWPIVLANIFCGICFTSIMMNLLVFDEAIGLGVFAAWMSVYNGCNIFTRGLGGIVADKIGNKKTLLVCMICLAAGLSIFAFTENYFLYLAAAVIYALGHGGFQAPMIAACVEAVEPERAGVASGTMYMGADFGAIVAGTIVGILVDNVGYHSTYAVTAGCAVAAFFIILLFYRARKTEEDKTVQPEAAK